MRLKIAEDLLEPLARPFDATTVDGLRANYGIDAEGIRQIVGINGLAPTKDEGLIVEFHLGFHATEKGRLEGVTQDEMRAGARVAAEFLTLLPTALQSEETKSVNHTFLSERIADALLPNGLAAVLDVFKHSCNCEKCAAEREMEDSGVDEPGLLAKLAGKTARSSSALATTEILDEPEKEPPFEPLGVHELGDGYLLVVRQREHATGTRFDAILRFKDRHQVAFADRKSVALALLDLQVILLREETTVPRGVAEALAPFFAYAQVGAESMLSETEASIAPRDEPAPRSMSEAIDV